VIKNSIILKLFVIFCIFTLGCKKDNQSTYNGLLAHLWTFKSSSSLTIDGVYNSGWKTKQAGPDETWNFSGGIWTTSSPGFTFSAPYETKSNNIILLENPATTVTPAGPPDTLFILALTDSLLVVNQRQIDVPDATINETTDSLTR
jgi:hypothetical protein